VLNTKENNITIIEKKMNARTLFLELTMEDCQINEALSSIFHTVLFHRSLGKFIYSNDASYSVGTVGAQDIDCDFIDFTYVCCSSPSLDRVIKREINSFSEQLRNHESCGAGQISLEFFQKKKRQWPFQAEFIPWEIWTVSLDLLELNSEDERLMCRERVGEMLTDKIFYITDVMNRDDYVPKTPSQPELDLIFDTSLPDVQPYLFKFRFSTSSGPAASTSVKSTMQKIIKETLSL
jgi:autophagy-related protein 101